VQKLFTGGVMADPTTVRDLVAAFLAEHDHSTMDRLDFLRARFDAGLAWVHFPAGLGGLGAPRALQDIVTTAFAEAGAPDNTPRRIGIGLGMAAPTILRHGTDEQRQRYLRDLWTGREVWCQLFSEPGAGSDLAGLGTRAVRDGDNWIVNGQKVWTSMAHEADRAILITRTDPDVPKHQGMTYFALDMHAPGVEVRPLRQITGEAEFNEVYLTDVRIPDADRIGDIGDGWRVSMTTLMNERTTIGAGVGGPRRGGGSIAEAIYTWNKIDDHSPARRNQLMKLWCDAEVLRLTNMRASQKARAGNPGPEGSISKLAFANLNKDVYEWCIDALGPAGIVDYDYTFRRPSEALLDGAPGSARKLFLRSRANSIEGGTSEIMRNILGERILGLPGEPRVDRDVPWSQVPRS
jgi:alkylation response protein AidB-like acyl-CoA dehydrogenase